MSNWFKRKSNKNETFSIYIKLKVQYPELLDDKKIYESIDAYYNTYFMNNPIKNIHFTGISNFLFGSSYPLVDHCIVQFVFDENVKEFVDDYQKQKMRSELSTIMGVERDQIQLQFISFSENQDSLGSAKSLLETYNKLKTIDDEICESNIKLKESNMNSEKENSTLRKKYYELREQGLTDPELDRVFDSLENKERLRQEEFNQIKNVFYELNPFSKKIDELINEILKYKIECKDKNMEFSKRYDELRQKGSTSSKSDELIDEYDEICIKQLARMEQLKYEYDERYTNDEKLCQHIIELERIRLKYSIDIPYLMRNYIILANSSADSNIKDDYFELIKGLIKDKDEAVKVLNSCKKK